MTGAPQLTHADTMAASASVAALSGHKRNHIMREMLWVRSIALERRRLHFASAMPPEQAPRHLCMRHMALTLAHFSQCDHIT